MKRKKCLIIASIILMAAVFIAVPVNNSYAASGLDNAVVTLCCKGGSAKCTTFASGLSGTSCVAITMTLQRSEKGTWVNKATWSGSKNSTSYVLSKSKSVSRGSYRVKSVIRIKSKNKTDTVTRYSAAARY